MPLSIAPEERQERQRRVQREHEQGGDARGGAALGDHHRPQHPDPMTEPAADELSRGPSGEDEREPPADAPYRRALAGEEKGQEGEEPHAYGGVEHAGRGEVDEGGALRAGRSATRRPVARVHPGARRQEDRDRGSDDHAEAGHPADGAAPGEDGDQEGHKCRQGRFAQVATEVVRAERRSRATRCRGVGARHRRRADRMLHARPRTGERESDAQPRQACRHPGADISGRRDERADRKHRASTEALRQAPGRKLQAGHRPCVQAAQEREHGIADGKLPLPQRQEHVRHVRVAVVQRMRGAGRDQRASSRGAGIHGHNLRRAPLLTQRPPPIRHRKIL